MLITVGNSHCSLDSIGNSIFTLLDIGLCFSPMLECILPKEQGAQGLQAHRMSELPNGRGLISSHSGSEAIV